MSNGEKVHQYRKQHCSDWYDGYPDESDGGGPYEVRTLYRAAQASTIVALKEQLASARNDALEDAVKVALMLTKIPGDLLGQPSDTMVRVADAGERIAAAIRALASQPAAPAAECAVTGAEGLPLCVGTCTKQGRCIERSQPAAPVQPERALAEENRQLMAKANEWRDKFNESEESRHELLRLLNEETSGTTFMGEPVLPQRATAQDVSGLVNRFLGWRLPDTFAPDCGISFDGRKDDEWNKNKSWPIGTNLLNATEAEAMFEYCLAAPVQTAEQVQGMTELQKYQIVAGCATDDLEQIHCALGFSEDQTIDAEDMIEAIRELQAATGTVPADAAPPVQQPGDVREALQFICDTFKRDLDAGYSTKDKVFAVGIASQALATTRPSAALTEAVEMLNSIALWWHADQLEVVSGDPSAFESLMESAEDFMLKSRLAASSGAVAVPEWISVDERLPEFGRLVMVYSPPTQYDHPGEVNISFDCIDPNDDDHASWLGHNEHYEHYCAVACADMIGPSQKAPYTHWHAIPAAPATPAQGQTK